MARREIARMRDKDGKLRIMHIESIMKHMHPIVAQWYDQNLDSASGCSFEKSKRAEEYIRNILKNHIKKNANCIYTDGSVKNKNHISGGAAFVHVKNGDESTTIHEQKKGIPTTDNVFAEFKGVEMALKYIHQKAKNYKNQEFNILTDCKVVPNTLNGLVSPNGKYFLSINQSQIFQAGSRREYGITTKFYWIPGHVKGSKGNEKADELAGEAANEVMEQRLP